MDQPSTFDVLISLAGALPKLQMRQLVTLCVGLSAELKARADLCTDSRAQYDLILAAMKLTEARGYMRRSQGVLFEAAHSPAAAVSEAQHGAVTPEGAQSPSTTTAAAGVFDASDYERPTLPPVLRLPPASHDAGTCTCVLCLGVRRKVFESPFSSEATRAELAPTLNSPTAEPSADAARAEGAHSEARSAEPREASGGRDLRVHLALVKAEGGSR